MLECGYWTTWNFFKSCRNLFLGSFIYTGGKLNSPVVAGELHEMKRNVIFHPLKNPKCQETIFVNKVM